MDQGVGERGNSLRKGELREITYPMSHTGITSILFCRGESGFRNHMSDQSGSVIWKKMRIAYQECMEVIPSHHSST